jgi:hypothetical protein
VDKQELTLKLEEEIAKGQRAGRAYNLYVKQFLETNFRELYDAFLNASTAEDALEIRRLVIANKELELTIVRDIDTCKMAKKQLESMKDEH